MVSQPWRTCSKDVDWLLLTWEDAIVEVAGELRLTVVISVGEQIDEEEEEFAAGATNVGYVVSADITKLTL